MRTASLKQHDSCVYKTCIQSLLLQINSTVHWHKQATVHPWFKVHQQPAQSTEEVWTAYLDTHHDHLWWLQRVLQYTYEVYISDRIKPRASQMIVSPIMRSMISTRVQSISKSVPVKNIENFEGSFVDCPKITEDKSSESRVQTPDARLIIATSAVPRHSLKAASQHHYSTDAELESRISASLQYQDARVETRISTVP